MPPIENLQRVPERALQRLERQGLFTTGLFLEVSETPTRRMTLADQIGVSTNDIDEWRDEALLLNLANFGPQQQRILTQAGVVGLSELLALGAGGLPRPGRAGCLHARPGDAPGPHHPGLVRAGPDAGRGLTRDDDFLPGPPPWPGSPAQRGRLHRHHPRHHRLAVLPLLTPAFTHPALDVAGSAGRLGVQTGVAHRWSDRSVAELVLGPGSFAFDGPDGPGAGPFYDAAERGHLADARLLLWLCLIAGAVSLLVHRRPHRSRRRASAGGRLWRIVSRAGATAAVAVILLGVVSLVAFDALFTLFHQVFFPGGNWSFDPATQRLVQLYPFAFWQVAAAAFGVLVAVLGVAAWWLGRRLGRSAPVRVGAATIGAGSTAGRPLGSRHARATAHEPRGRAPPHPVRRPAAALGAPAPRRGPGPRPGR